MLVERHGAGGVMGGGILGIEGVETGLEGGVGVHGVTLGAVCACVKWRPRRAAPDLRAFWSGCVAEGRCGVWDG
ncbi:hypothetical protein [Sulfitobacter sediminilitoris]|uniref:hypothetical protein n=1 Tax=Sulfitobacter sediminilitoris TaxID=2698830 RepID=UPI00361E524C